MKVAEARAAAKVRETSGRTTTRSRSSTTPRLSFIAFWLTVLAKAVKRLTSRDQRRQPTSPALLAEHCSATVSGTAFR